MISLCTLLVDGYLKELTPSIVIHKIIGNKTRQTKIKNYLRSGMNIVIVLKLYMSYTLITKLSPTRPWQTMMAIIHIFKCISIYSRFLLIN